MFTVTNENHESGQPTDAIIPPTNESVEKYVGGWVLALAEQYGEVSINRRVLDVSAVEFSAAVIEDLRVERVGMLTFHDVPAHVYL